MLCYRKKRAWPGQTLASQGMIHGGTKYALDGLLTKAASEIGAMPALEQALQGKGTVDLSHVQLEREDQLLWSVESIAANLLGFFASKAMRSRMERIDPHPRRHSIIRISKAICIDCQNRC